MKALATLTPAETLLVMHDERVKLRYFLKVTLMDLLLRQVLKTVTVTRQPNKRDPEKQFIYIERGDAFIPMPLPHERIYTKPFSYTNTTSILFRHFVKIAAENARDVGYYRGQIRKSPALAECYSQSFFQRNVFGGFTRTEQAALLGTTLGAELEHLENHLPQLLTNNTAQALEVIKVIGGNVFLLQNVKIDMLQQIDALLMDELRRPNVSVDAVDLTIASGCSGGGWSWMGEAHESDSMFGDDMGDDSGCGADAGDSSDSGGDSGCGGCGGCGGD